jgi:hypothetical protein
LLRVEPPFGLQHAPVGHDGQHLGVAKRLAHRAAVLVPRLREGIVGALDRLEGGRHREHRQLELGAARGRPRGFVVAGHRVERPVAPEVLEDAAQRGERVLLRDETVDLLRDRRDEGLALEGTKTTNGKKESWSASRGQ